MDELADLGDQILAVETALEEGEDSGELSCPHPMLSLQVMPVDVDRTEDWSTLGRSNVVLNLLHLPVFLLFIWIFRKFSERVGKLVAVDLLDRIQQDYRGLHDLLASLFAFLLVD